METKKAVGLDIGSQTIKAVVLDDTRILSSTIVLTGDDAEISAKNALEQALQKAGTWSPIISYITATGVGVKAATFSQQQKGSYHLPGTRGSLPDSFGSACHRHRCREQYRY